VLTQLIMVVVIEAFDGGLLDRAVHPFDLTVGPRVFWLGRSVLDIGLGAGIFEGMNNGIQYTTPGAGGSAVPLIKEAMAAGETIWANGRVSSEVAKRTWLV
jgi:hypothetical protein